MGSVSTINWTFPSPTPNLKVVQIDLNPEILGNNSQNTLNVAGDARLVLEDLLVLVRDAIPKRSQSEWINDLNQERQEFWEDFNEPQDLSESPIKPQQLVNILNRHLTETSVVIADAGTPTPSITRYLKLER